MLELQSTLCSAKHVTARKSNLVFGHWFHQAGKRWNAHCVLPSVSMLFGLEGPLQNWLNFNSIYWCLWSTCFPRHLHEIHQRITISVASSLLLKKHREGETGDQKRQSKNYSSVTGLPTLAHWPGDSCNWSIFSRREKQIYKGDNLGCPG